MTEPSRASGEPVDHEFTISRTFDAPRDLVFKVWTEPEHLVRWWGPKGSTVVSCKVDLRPGGTFHYGLRSPDGTDYWGKFVYREIVPPERLVFIVSFADEEQNIIRHPFAADWPLEILSTVTFEESGGKTAITVRWLPHNATDLERKTFADGRDSMQQGWTGTFDQLEAYLGTAGS